MNNENTSKTEQKVILNQGNWKTKQQVVLNQRPLKAQQQVVVNQVPLKAERQVLMIGGPTDGPGKKPMSAIVGGTTSMIAANRVGEKSTDQGYKFGTYLLSIEKNLLVPVGYLSRHPELNPSYRAMLIDWMHYAYKCYGFNIQTLFMSVTIVDHYLARAPTISLKEFQLVGITAMRLASKYVEITMMPVNEYLAIIGKPFTPKILYEMEAKMFNTLGFDLPRPLALEYLRYLLQELHVQPKIAVIAMLLLNVTTYDAEMSVVKPTQLASTLLLMAYGMVSPRMVWIKEFEKIVPYTILCLLSYVNKIATLAVSAPDNSLQAVVNKYSYMVTSKIMYNSYLALVSSYSVSI